MVKPGGTGMPILHISARLAPLPPSSSFILPSPSAVLPPKEYTYLPFMFARREGGSPRPRQRGFTIGLRTRGRCGKVGTVGRRPPAGGSSCNSPLPAKGAVAVRDIRRHLHRPCPRLRVPELQPPHEQRQIAVAAV